MLIQALALAAFTFAPDENLLRDNERNSFDQFYPVGFSRTGLFAFVVVKDGDEAGYNAYSASVINLDDDSFIAHVSREDDDGPMALVEFGMLLQEMLDQYGIVPGGTRVGAEFEAEQQFRVVVDKRREHVTAVFVERNGQRKRITSIKKKAEVDTGHADFLAVILSPFERRAAVLLKDMRWTGGCAGSFPTVVVVGADLDARY